MRLLDPNHAFFDPAWRRWAAILLPLLWAGVEAARGYWGWAALFTAAGLYVAFELLWRRGR